MKKKRASRIQDNKSELDMTSMIDVVFLLLIFFMCATKFKIPEGALRSFLPRDRGDQSTSPVISRGCRLTLLMDPNNAGTVICYADDALIPTDLEMGEFEQHRGFPGPNLLAIEDHVQRRKDNYTGLSDKGLPVIIDFNKAVPYKYVIDMLNLCKKLEIEDIGFAAPDIPIE